MLLFMLRALALLTAMSALLCGCFDSKHVRTNSAPPARTVALPPAPPADVGTARLWSNFLDDGLVEQAAHLFTVPAVVQNGGPPARLTSYAQILAFNAGLPCGAKFARSYARGRYVVAVFVLVDRPGHDCGVDYGHEAATEFLVQGGRIAEWRALNERIPSG